MAVRTVCCSSSQMMIRKFWLGVVLCMTVQTWKYHRAKRLRWNFFSMLVIRIFVVESTMHLAVFYPAQSEKEKYYTWIYYSNTCRYLYAYIQVYTECIWILNSFSILGILHLTTQYNLHYMNVLTQTCDVLYMISHVLHTTWVKRAP